MATELNPYIQQYPGNLITAEENNKVQMMIKEDIANQINDSIEKIERVNNAGDAEKLGGKTSQELTDEIIQKVLENIPERTGYMKIFKKLKVGEEVVIMHDLKSCPLVDVYQLEYFKVICAVDEDLCKAWVTFYLYHTSEKKIKYTDTDKVTHKKETIEIEPADGHPYRVLFKDMLYLYKVKYTDDSSLGDLETEFWKAFFSDPNDEFDFEQYCHSPWYERCCREERTVGTLKKKGDWDDLWFQMRPRKTINYPYPGFEKKKTEEGNCNLHPAPTQIQVCHFDFNTLGIKLLEAPVYCGPGDYGEDGFKYKEKEEIKVMLLLKV
jgi:hypothetical protein